MLDDDALGDCTLLTRIHPSTTTLNPPSPRLRRTPRRQVDEIWDDCLSTSESCDRNRRGQLPKAQVNLAQKWSRWFSVTEEERTDTFLGEGVKDKGRMSEGLWG